MKTCAECPHYLPILVFGLPLDAGLCHPDPAQAKRDGWNPSMSAFEIVSKDDPCCGRFRAGEFPVTTITLTPDELKKIQGC